MECTLFSVLFDTWTFLSFFFFMHLSINFSQHSVCVYAGLNPAWSGLNWTSYILMYSYSLCFLQCPLNWTYVLPLIEVHFAWHLRLNGAHFLSEKKLNMFNYNINTKCLLEVITGHCLQGHVCCFDQISTKQQVETFKHTLSLQWLQWEESL